MRSIELHFSYLFLGLEYGEARVFLGRLGEMKVDIERNLPSQRTTKSATRSTALVWCTNWSHRSMLMQTRMKLDR